MQIHGLYELQSIKGKEKNSSIWLKVICDIKT